MSDNFYLMLKGTLQTYLLCAKKASGALIKNWPIVPASGLLFIVLYLCLLLFGGLGLAGGFLVGMLQIALLAWYYSWIAAACNNDKLTSRSLLEYDTAMFFQLISVAFILYLISWAAKMLLTGIQNNYLFFISLNLIIVFAFNPVPEVIHEQRLEGMAALGKAAGFCRDNCLEWFAPLVVLFIPAILLFSPERVLIFFANSEVLMPFYSVQLTTQSLFMNTAPSLVLFVLCLLVAGNWLMIFRGFLFNELESGTRRQRMFKAKST